jgi:uncharacterized protein (TIGR00375 family)
MFYIADLHVHSHFSRATSKELNLESLYQWARIKGINVVGTGDFTHPQWFKEIREKLEPDGNGFFRLKNPPRDPALPGTKVQDIDVRFCLSTEISSIYKHGDRVRKNHNMVYAPDFDTVARINARLSTIGNLTADGRPILGLPSRDLLEIVIGCSDQAYLVPAHVWTPWFSTLGSKGGYDSIDACFRDLTGHIFALETGLSSDPAMNWKWSALDRFTLISNSDAHSPQKLGREANLFDTDYSYDGLFNALKSRQGFLGTYEFFPEEGKYHLDGHRACGVILEPKDTIRCKGICPVCGKPLTVGVLNRVEELSDRSIPQKPEGSAGYEYLIPLPEILAEIKGSGPESKTVIQAYQQTISVFGNEFSLLEKVPVDEIKRYADPILAEAIRRMRSQQVNPQPGFDGVYGVIRIFEEGELAKLTGQLHLFGIMPPLQPEKTDHAPVLSGADNLHVLEEPVVLLKTAGLNEAQQEVKKSVTGAVLVKAGPGTGKTSTLIQWIGNQIASGQAKPSEVLAITFTNKAAREIGERLAVTLGGEAGQIIAGTFHAIAYRMLQQYDPELNTVYDEANRLSVIRFLFPEMSESDCKQLSAALTLLFERNEDNGFGSLRDYATAYRQYASGRKAIDLSDLTGRLVSLWKEDPGVLEKQRSQIRAIAVDEFQDINALQYEFLTLLGQNKNLLAIGDPDQAIYGFRGSDVRLFFRFTTDFSPKEISLTENYRSVPVVLKAAGQLITRNTLRSGLNLQATRFGKQKIKLFRAENPEKEARFIAVEIEKKIGGFNLLSGGTAYHEGDYAFSDLAVLYRTHQVGRELLSHFKQANIPVIPGDGTAFLSTEPFTLIACAFKSLLRPDDLMALEGILNHLPGWKRGDIRTFLSQLHESGKIWPEALPAGVNSTATDHFFQWKTFYRELAAQLSDLNASDLVCKIFDRYLPDHQLNEEQILKKEIILAMAEEAGTDIQQFLNDATLNNFTDTGRRQAHGIHLLTFHAAKGLEFPVVFIAGAEEGITPSGREDADQEEERRLFYVAMTRARDELYITHADKRIRYGKEEQHQPSRFISEFSSDLVSPMLPAKVKQTKPQQKDDQLSLF